MLFNITGGVFCLLIHQNTW